MFLNNFKIQFAAKNLLVIYDCFICCFDLAPS